MALYINLTHFKVNVILQKEKEMVHFTLELLIKILMQYFFIIRAKLRALYS